MVRCSWLMRAIAIGSSVLVSVMVRTTGGLPLITEGRWAHAFHRSRVGVGKESCRDNVSDQHVVDGDGVHKTTVLSIDFIAL